jgi:hypothetical protein
MELTRWERLPEPGDWWRGASIPHLDLRHASILDARLRGLRLGLVQFRSCPAQGVVSLQCKIAWDAATLLWRRGDQGNALRRPPGMVGSKDGVATHCTGTRWRPVTLKGGFVMSIRYAVFVYGWDGPAARPTVVSESGQEYR